MKRAQIVAVSCFWRASTLAVWESMKSVAKPSRWSKWHNASKTLPHPWTMPHPVLNAPNLSRITTRRRSTMTEAVCLYGAKAQLNINQWSKTAVDRRDIRLIFSTISSTLTSWNSSTVSFSRIWPCANGPWKIGENCASWLCCSRFVEINR